MELQRRLPFWKVTEQREDTYLSLQLHLLHYFAHRCLINILILFYYSN